MKKIIKYARAAVGIVLIVPATLLLTAGLAIAAGYRGVNAAIDGLDAMTDSL